MRSEMSNKHEQQKQARGYERPVNPVRLNYTWREKSEVYERNQQATLLGPNPMTG